MRRRSSSAVAVANVRWASPFVIPAAAVGEFIGAPRSFADIAILTQDLYTIYDLTGCQEVAMTARSSATPLPAGLPCRSDARRHRNTNADLDGRASSATKRLEELRQDVGCQAGRSGDPTRGFLCDPWTVRLWQDNTSAHDRRLCRTDLRHDRDRRQGCHGARSGAAPDQHGLPGLWSVPAYDGQAERRLWLAHRQAPQAGNRRSHQGGAGARPSRGT